MALLERGVRSLLLSELLSGLVLTAGVLVVAGWLPVH